MRLGNKDNEKNLMHKKTADLSVTESRQCERFMDSYY